jgi:hypothetical protein
MTHRSYRSWIAPLVKILLVREMGIRDISAVMEISIDKVLNVLTSSTYEIKPKRSHYDCLEIDEFWTYLGEKRSTKYNLSMHTTGKAGRLRHLSGRNEYNGSG